MFNKRREETFLLEEPQNIDKKSKKKIIIDIIGIILVVAIIVGTYIFIVNREEILSNLPITTDEKGRIIFNTKTRDGSESRSTEKMEESSTFTPVNDYTTAKIEIPDKKLLLNDAGDGYIARMTFRKTGSSTTGSIPAIIYCEKVTIDGFEMSNSFQVDLSTENSVTVDIELTNTDLQKYNIIKPNNMNLFLYTEAEKQKAEEDGYYPIAKKVNFHIGYNAPMDNSIKGLVPIGKLKDATINFYKQIADNEYTYLYFDIKNTSGSAKKTIRVKKLLVNDKVYELNDLNEESHFQAEKVFYIRIPKKDIPTVKKFTISFFVITDEGLKSENIYVTNEYTHSE